MTTILSKFKPSKDEMAQEIMADPAKLEVAIAGAVGLGDWTLAAHLSMMLERKKEIAAALNFYAEAKEKEKK